MVKHGGVPYVFKDLQEGRTVVKLLKGKWVNVGRVTKWAEIFLGEGQSMEEHNHSPEGLEASRKLMQSLQASRFSRMNVSSVKKFEFPTTV